MRYLHGDSTPFPLNQNFLETLAKATDTCVAIFEAEIAIERLRQVTASSDDSAADELARVDRLGRAVATAIAPFAPADSPSRAVEAAAIRAGQVVRAALDEARDDIAKWRAETIASAQPTNRSMLELLGSFGVQHELPETTWAFEWVAPLRGRAGSARVDSWTAGGIHGTYTCETVPDHLWSKPVRVGSIARDIWIPVLQKGWFGKPKWKPERLDNYWIVGAWRDDERVSLTIAKSRRDRSKGFDLVLRSRDGEVCFAQPLDARGANAGERIALDGESRQGLLRLWHTAEETLLDLVRCRKTLVAATLEGVPVDRLDRPSLLADALIASIAPVVCEMHRHSRSRGELALKRDLGDGRREEMFVAHDEIRDRYERLPPTYQVRFDPFDLEDGSTNVYTLEEVGVSTPRARDSIPSEAGA